MFEDVGEGIKSPAVHQGSLQSSKGDLNQTVKR